MPDNVTKGTILLEMRTSNNKSTYEVFYPKTSVDQLEGSLVTGIKVNDETTYRTGEINLSKKDFGIDKIESALNNDFADKSKAITDIRLSGSGDNKQLQLYNANNSIVGRLNVKELISDVQLPSTDTNIIATNESDGTTNKSVNGEQIFIRSIQDKEDKTLLKLTSNPTTILSNERNSNVTYPTIKINIPTANENQLGLMQAGNNVNIKNGIISIADTTIKNIINNNPPDSVKNVKQLRSTENGDYPILASSKLYGSIGDNITTTTIYTQITMNPNVGRITAKELEGTLIGTANRAVSDKDGKQIDTTYAPLQNPTFEGMPKIKNSNFDWSAAEENHLTTKKYVDQTAKNANTHNEFYINAATTEKSTNHESTTSNDNTHLNLIQKSTDDDKTNVVTSIKIKGEGATTVTSTQDDNKQITLTITSTDTDNDKNVLQQERNDNNNKYPLLASIKTSDKITGDVTSTTIYHKNITVNPKTQTITAENFEGTASQANQLKKIVTIDGVNFNGTRNIIHYGTCSTAADQAQKDVDCDNFELMKGAWIAVTFTTTNTADKPQLNVNQTGAKAICYRNSTAILKDYLIANRTYLFVYNSRYELIGDINTDNNVNQQCHNANYQYPILLANKARATADIASKPVLFGSDIRINPSTATIYTNSLQAEDGIKTENLIVQTDASVGNNLIIGTDLTIGNDLTIDNNLTIAGGKLTLNENSIQAKSSDIYVKNLIASNEISTPKNIYANKVHGDLIGNADTVTKLKEPITIDGVSFDGSTDIIHYAECSTDGDLEIKIVTCADFTAVKGAMITVKFMNTDTSANTTNLRVDSTNQTGVAHPIYYNNTRIKKETLKKNYVYSFVYTGSRYELIGEIDTDEDKSVYQKNAKVDKNYPILMAHTTTGEEVTSSVLFNDNIKINPSTATIITNNLIANNKISTIQINTNLLTVTDKISTTTINTKDLIVSNGISTKNIYTTNVYGELIGNSSTATRLKNSVTIDGVSFDGINNVTHYVICDEAGENQQKSVTHNDFKCNTGAWIAVKFNYDNTAANPTLKINNDNARAIYYKGNPIPATALKANKIYLFVYNDNRFEVIGNLDDDNDKVDQNISTVNSTYPILLANKENATANIAASNTIFGKDIKINPSTATLYTNNLVVNNKISSSIINTNTLTANTITGELTGNSSTTTQLKNSKKIDGVSFDGTTDVTHYAECNTEGSSEIKEIMCNNFNAVEGAMITVKFTNTDTSINNTHLQVKPNQTNPSEIFYNNKPINKGTLKANYIYSFIYNGSQYELIGEIDTDEDKLVYQQLTFENQQHPILLANTINSTSMTLFSDNIKINPSTATIITNNLIANNKISTTQIDTDSLIANNKISTTEINTKDLIVSNGISAKNIYTTNVYGELIGNSSTATQLKNSKTIDGVPFDGTNNITHYAICTTASDVQIKVVDVNFSVADGAKITIKFINGNTHNTAYLKFNNSATTYPLIYKNKQIPNLKSNGLYSFICNNNQFELIGDLDTDFNNKVDQNISTINSTYPILLANKENATTNIEASNTIFGSDIKINPSTATLYTKNLVVNNKISSSVINTDTLTANTITGTLIGNANTATQLKESITIDGISFDGSTDVTHYVACMSSRSANIKEITCDSFNEIEGALLTIKFVNGNTAENPNLSINTATTTLSYPLAYKNKTISALDSNGIYSFILKKNDSDNNKWQFELIGDLNVNENDKVAQNINTENQQYPILMANTINGNAVTSSVLFNDNIKINPSAATITTKNLIVSNEITTTKIIASSEISTTKFYGELIGPAEKLKTERHLRISDNDEINMGNEINFDGTKDITIKLPKVIKADLIGNASTATLATRAINAINTDNDSNGDNIISTYAKLSQATGIGKIDFTDSDRILKITSLDNNNYVNVKIPDQKISYYIYNGKPVSSNDAPDEEEIQLNTNLDKDHTFPLLFARTTSSTLNPAIDNYNTPAYISSKIHADLLQGIIQANSFIGNFSGTVSNAISDKNGNQIDTTYATKTNSVRSLSLDSAGHVITYTMGDNTTSTLTITDINTDSTVKQTPSTNNATYPLLAADIIDLQLEKQSSTIFGKDIKINPSTSTIFASTFKGNLSGVASRAISDETGNNIVSTYAPLVSPVLIGEPQAPTPDQTINNNRVATTEFVKTAINNLHNTILGSNESTSLTTLNDLTIAVNNKQPIDDGLTSISKLETQADRMIYTTAKDTYTVTTLTSTARSLIDDPDIQTMRNTLDVPSRSGLDATGTWNINIFGNANTASTLKTARKISLSGAVTSTPVDFDGSKDIVIPVNSLYASNLIGLTNISINGNASTASVLASSRNLSISDYTNNNLGKTVGFNGSKDIVIPLPQVIEANLTGTADHAISDNMGNNIISTYETKTNAITKLDISNQIITYTKGNGVTGTITTQDKLVRQINSNSNTTYPILASSVADANDEYTTETIFDPEIKINPHTSEIIAKKFTGTFSGTVENAKNDENGNEIISTYARKDKAVHKLTISDNNVISYFDANDNKLNEIQITDTKDNDKVEQISSIEDHTYPILAASIIDQSSTVVDKSIFNKDIKLNPALGNIYASTFIGDLRGNATSATKAVNDGDNLQIDTTYAKLAGATFTGSIFAPTAPIATSNTQVATTEFVTQKINNLIGSASLAFDTLGELVEAVNNKQPIDDGLTSISKLETQADRMIYTTAKDTYTVTTLTSTARSLIDDPDIQTMRNTLDVPSRSGLDATGTWNIDIFGNANTASTLKNARKISLSGAVTSTPVDFDGSKDIVIPVNSLYASNLIGLTNISISGNADSATKLKDSVTFRISDYTNNNLGNTVDFNGTKNTVIQLPETIEININGLASHATNDQMGNNIISTYETKANAITKLDISNQIITYTKGNGTTGTITTQDKLVRQINSNSNTTYPILASSVANADDEYTTETIFDPEIKINPHTSEIIAKKFTGTFSGTVENATNDGNGNEIISTYARKDKAVHKLHIGNDGIIHYLDANDNDLGTINILPSFTDENTDINVRQINSNSNSTYPILASSIADATDENTTTSIYAQGVKINPNQNSIIANTFIGNLSGTASHAKSDENGNEIITTYETKANAITKLEISGLTITYTKGDSSTGSITIDNTNTDTKMTQTLKNDNNTYPILAAGIIDQSTTTIGDGIFTENIKINPYLNEIRASTFKGNLSGKADIAVKDENENNIIDTYMQKVYLNTTVLSSSNWTEDNGIYYTTFLDSNIKSNHLVNVIINQDSQVVASQANMLPINENNNGTVKLYAKIKPTANINITYYVLTLKS